MYYYRVPNPHPKKEPYRQKVKSKNGGIMGQPKKHGKSRGM